mgnify:CR=1 FL=1
MGDAIELRITDGGPPGHIGQDGRFTIPVLVMPKDDSPPEITSNIMIQGTIKKISHRTVFFELDHLNIRPNVTLSMFIPYMREIFWWIIFNRW